MTLERTVPRGPTPRRAREVLGLTDRTVRAVPGARTGAWPRVRPMREGQRRLAGPAGSPRWIRPRPAAPTSVR